MGILSAIHWPTVIATLVVLVLLGIVAGALRKRS